MMINDEFEWFAGGKIVWIVKLGIQTALEFTTPETILKLCENGILEAEALHMMPSDAFPRKSSWLAVTGMHTMLTSTCSHIHRRWSTVFAFQRWTEKQAICHVVEIRKGAVIPIIYHKKPVIYVVLMRLSGAANTQKKMCAIDFRNLVWKLYPMQEV